MTTSHMTKIETGGVRVAQLVSLEHRACKYSASGSNPGLINNRNIPKMTKIDTDGVRVAQLVSLKHSACN